LSAIPYETELTIPKKFQQVDIEKVLAAETRVEELLAIVKKVHPWSSLHYGLSASDVVRKLYMEWIPKYLGTQDDASLYTLCTRLIQI